MTRRLAFGAQLITQRHVTVDEVVDLAVQAEEAGFDYVGLADTHVIWHDCWPILTLIARATSRIRIAPFVTNPGTRDWTVLASLLATLDHVSGGRVVCGIGRGDSARRTIGLGPVRLQDMEACILLVRELFAGRAAPHNGVLVRLEWAGGHELEVWGAGYGPRALELVGRRCDGFILQLADPEIAGWAVGRVRQSAMEAGREPGDVRVVATAPALVTGDVTAALPTLRWFGGAVANHAVDMIRHSSGDELPPVLTKYVAGRPAYDYTDHGSVGNPRTDYVPDEITQRFCVVGDAGTHIDKLRELHRAGVDVFHIYFQPEHVHPTLEIYRDEIIPELRS
jgi:probable F420-dependent oxidoreductase